MLKHFCLTFVVLTSLSACSPSFQSGARDSVIVEQLFFGRNAQGVQAVSDSAWVVFLRDVVTPRFPEGFTVWSAQGQWLGANDQVEHEPSFVLELVHPKSATADADISVIMTEYKRRFRQESVLRVVLPGRATF
jgi:hypothetical protein